MMLGGQLVLLSVLCQVQPITAGSNPAAFVEQLGSGRFAEREAAARALEAIGRPALSSLRNARQSRDPEVRTRAAALMEKIEDALLTQPSRLQLNFPNAPLPDVVKSLIQQTGFRIELHPQNSPKWRSQRVDLQEPEPVDFWKAIDKLCDRGGLQYNARTHGYGGNGESIFALTDGMNRAVTPISDHGPFRVSLISLEYQKRVSYAPIGATAHVPAPPRPVVVERRRPEASLPPRLNPVTSSQCFAQLLVAAEPRLSLSQVRPAQLVEAVDDRGNSLIAMGDDEPIRNRYVGSFGASTSSVVQIQAPLLRPETAGKWIKKLRGFVHLTVAARRPDPLVIPLLKSAGKTFETQELRLTIHDIRPDPANRNLLIELSIKANDNAESSDRVDRELFSDGLQRVALQPLQIEIVDTNGQIIPWFQSAADPGRSRFTLMLTNQATPNNLKELRYFTLNRAPAKIPFEFQDIPMP